MSTGFERPAGGAAPETPGTAPTRRRRWPSVRAAWAILVALVIASAAAGVWRYRVTRPGHRFEVGLEAVARHDWPTARRAADRLMDSGHADEGSVLRAEMHYAQKDPEAALAECNRVQPNGGPLHLRAAALTGKCMLNLGEPGQAQRAFAFVVRVQPDNADAHRGLAAAAYDLGQTDQAMAHLGEVARLDPADYRPHRLAGNIHKDAGSWAKAEAEYRKALVLGGAPPGVGDEIHGDLADALINQSMFAEALDALEGVTHGDPHRPRLVALRAESLRGVGRGAEAAALVDQALATDPTSALFRLRGQLYLDAGNAAGAIPMLEEAARRGHVPYQSYFLLAQAYRLADRADDAARATKRAEELRRDVETAAELSRQAQARPGDAAVRLQLAAVFDRLGEADLAAVWRRAAASLGGRH